MWIQSGHTNPVVENYPEGEVKKVIWNQMHLEAE